MPSKRIIILENQTQTQLGNEAPKIFRAAFWADVPAARQAFYMKTATPFSAWPGASAAELTAIQTGTVTERVLTVPIAFNVNLASAQTALQAIWTDYQAEITAANPWNRYGSFWDGTTWTLGGAV